jgi:hypothetical protein
MTLYDIKALLSQGNICNTDLDSRTVIVKVYLPKLKESQISKGN